jgi:hypothetical protein
MFQIVLKWKQKFQYKILFSIFATNSIISLNATLWRLQKNHLHATS